MAIDVMIVGGAEAIASRPSDAMFTWIESQLEDFDIRYGSVALDEGAVQELRARFGDDPVGEMLIEKIERLKARGDQAPYLLELMISC